MTDFESIFNNLNKAMSGIDNKTFFLVNDSNNEIKQHYDEYYKSPFDRESFINSQKSKNEYLNKLNINYALFVVPDKSIIQRKFLPFETMTPRRHVNELDNIIYDCYEVLDENDSMMTDTHISKTGGVKVATYILSKMHPEKTYDEYNKLLWSKLYTKPNKNYRGDLVFDVNWSYGKGELYKKVELITVDDVLFVDDIKSVNDYPSKFKTFIERPSEYYYNENALTDKRLLVFNDSHATFIKHGLIAYYKEVFLYWDHWYFNQELIEWFKPDDLIEVRTERFLDNPLCPIIKEDSVVPVPVIIKYDEFNIKDNHLLIGISLLDSHSVPVKTMCKIEIDNIKIDSFDIDDGIINRYYDLNKFSQGNHNFILTVYPSNKTILRQSIKSFNIE